MIGGGGLELEQQQEEGGNMVAEEASVECSEYTDGILQSSVSPATHSILNSYVQFPVCCTLD